MVAMPANQQNNQQSVQKAIWQMNRTYMKNTVKKKAVCPPASGVGLTQPYALGSMLTFSAPTANNAFLEGFHVIVDLKVDLAAGSSATYAATASRELALIQEIDVLYNDTQFKFYPYILPHLRALRGIYQPVWPDSVLAGVHNSTTDTYVTSGALPTSSNAQLVHLEFYVPLNMIHPQDSRGLLPIDGTSTQVQINVQCASALMGNDPINNTWYASGGTGNAVTLTSAYSPTVQLIAKYRDGSTFGGPVSLPLQTAGMGTVQFQYDIPLTNLTAGQIYRQKISKLQQHYYAILTVVDGQQANKYCTEANLTYLDFVTDSTGANPFWRYGIGTNMSIQEYFIGLRDMLKQDLAEGIIPLVFAPIDNESDPNNLNGTHVLNMDPSTGAGNFWSDVHYGLQFSSLASTLSGVTPRCIMHLVWVSNQGLIATS